MDTRVPRNRLEQAQEFVKTLADSAKAHHATLDGEADLPVQQALEASGKSLSATAQTGDAQGTIGGGSGTVAMLGRPDLVIAAPAGIASHTPADTIASAGNTATFVAGQDLQQLAQADSATAVKEGIAFYTAARSQGA